MKLQIEYVHDGQPGTVTTLPADFIKWEKVTKQKITDLFTKEGDFRVGIGDLAVLIWAVLGRTHGLNEPVEVWQLKLEDVDFGEPEDPKATNSEASSGSDSSMPVVASSDSNGTTSTGTTSIQ